jgi:hypothetical protein
MSPNETTSNEAVSRGSGPSIELLIAEMRIFAETIEAAVRDEIERSVSRNPSDPNYSMLARSLGTRLSNLRATIEALEAAKLQRAERSGPGLPRRDATFTAA